MKLRVRDGGDVQRQWTATEMPRMRHDLVEHARGDLDRLAHPGVRDVLRRERVGQFNEFTKKPVTDEMFEAELAGQIDRTRRDLERYRESELFWVTRDMTRVAMDASTDIPAWMPATTVPAATGLLIWAEPLPRLCWYGTKELSYVTADAVQWVHDGGFVDIDILTRTDQLVAEGHLDKPGRRGPFVKPNLRGFLGAVGVLTCWFARNTRRNVVTNGLDFRVICKGPPGAPLLELERVNVWRR